MILGNFNDFDVKQLALDIDLSDIVLKPTRGLNILDHILVSENFKPYYYPLNVSYESPLGKSDHISLVATPSVLSD